MLRRQAPYQTASGLTRGVGGGLTKGEGREGGDDQVMGVEGERTGEGIVVVTPDP